MVTVRQVKTGVANYFEETLMTNISGLEKVIVGTGIAMYISKLDNIVSNVEEMPVIKALDIIRGENIDIDTVHRHLREQLQREGAVSIDLPIIKMKMNVDDLDNMVRRIKEA